MIGDAPCRLEGGREVSEGQGLREERLRGRRTEEREESGGADQILTADGAQVFRRAVGGWPRKAARGSGGSCVDESGRG
jgi:hypothetical protein